MVTVPLVNWSMQCSNNCDLVQLIIWIIFGLIVVLVLSMVFGIISRLVRAMRRRK
jgi:hypothetical protein